MKIIVATGGTGGHIFPALQTASVLRGRGHEVIFVGVLDLGEEKVKTQGFPTIVIHAKGLTNRSLIGLLTFGFLMFQAVGQGISVLRRTRPDKVIGFGGYGSFAVVLSAWLLRIPTMIHEQNVVPGKANRFLERLVKKVAISFSETENYFNSKKTVLTGCPCHHKRPLDSKEVLLKKFSLDPQRKTVFVLGGSQGSQKINEVFFEMMSLWGPKQPIQAIHMTGIKEYPLYLEKYRNSLLPVKVYEFISPIEEVYAVSDAVIARAGAATISELGFFVLPCILVPYPLADGHQKYNAQVLSRLGLAEIIEQKDLTADALKNTLKDLFTLKSDRKPLYQNVKEAFKDSAANELALAVESL